VVRQVTLAATAQTPGAHACVRTWGGAVAGASQKQRLHAAWVLDPPPGRDHGASLQCVQLSGARTCTGSCGGGRWCMYARSRACRLLCGCARPAFDMYTAAAHSQCR
jgi:hypothetical protein